MMIFSAYDTEEDRDGFDVSLNPYEIAVIEPAENEDEDWNLVVITMSTGDEYFIGGTVTGLTGEIKAWEAEQSIRAVLNDILEHLEAINCREGRKVGESW
jgi:hypothetical protein